MLMPKKTKYRKHHKVQAHGKATSGAIIAFGTYALKANGNARLNSRQIEASRRCIARATKRIGKMWIRIFPHLPVSKKPAEVRMGSGKGSVDHWVAPIYQGQVLFELDGVTEEVARHAFELAAMKLPLDVKFVKRVD